MVLMNLVQLNDQKRELVENSGLLIDTVDSLLHNVAAVSFHCLFAHQSWFLVGDKTAM